MDINTRVSINNSGSAFRGVIGTVTRRTARGMFEVTFDQPFHGHATALFFEHELQKV